MQPATDATIVPIQLVVKGRAGVTLWAPPWEEDGDEWQAFLGTGEKVEVFESTEDMAAFVARSPDNDLVDHPSWDMVQTLPATQLEPEDDFRFDLDGVPELVAGKPTDDTVAELADNVDMVQRIAECVDDGPLQRMLEDPVLAGLLDEDDPSYDDEDWEEVQTTITRSWSLVLERVAASISWHASGDEDADTRPVADAAGFWDEVGILPVSLRLPDGRTGYTLRCYLDDAAIFLGSELTVDVFTRPSDLVEFCHTGEGHDLADLDTWPAVRGAAVLDVSPALGDRYDLTSSNRGSREIAGDVADYCRLEGVQDTLGSDQPDWDLVVTEIESSLRWHD